MLDLFQTSGKGKYDYAGSTRFGTLALLPKRMAKTKTTREQFEEEDEETAGREEGGKGLSSRWEGEGLGWAIAEEEYKICFSPSEYYYMYIWTN